ncbi:MAG: histidine kinase [Pedobacter sp.]|nr:histidine kinase [Pedobacter sp.]
MSKKLTAFIFLIFSASLCLGSPGGTPIKLSRNITVRDGLPQSYISGLFQDEDGFLWISTLNGLARYDGREIKRFQHASTDQSGLSGNIILKLFNAGKNNIWLWYVDGKIDQFNTKTGKVVHLWKNPDFQKLKKEDRLFKTLVRNTKGTTWMMAKDGGIYQIEGKTVIHVAPEQLQLQSPLLGIGVKNEQLLLLTQADLVVYEQGKKVFKRYSHPFGKIDLFKFGFNIYSPITRKNGELIICDAYGLKIWNMGSRRYTSIRLGERPELGKLLAAFDRAGNFYFEFEHGIYLLRADNTLEKWSSPAPTGKDVPTSLLIDRSGVFWVGTNGFGLNQYNLVKTGLPGYVNQYSFVSDVLLRTGVPAKQIDHPFLSKVVSFANRSTTYKDSIWITDIYKGNVSPQLMLVVGHAAQIKTFSPAFPGMKKEIQLLKFLTTEKNGTIWGINQRYEILKLNTQRLSFENKGKITIDSMAIINGMVAEGHENLYICSDKGLFRYHTSTGKTEDLSVHLPTIDLLHLARDPEKPEVLWIGTLSDGLLRFNLKNKALQVFNTTTGLPNNTIYSILVGNDKQLWCSSNKGIFSFGPANHAIRSFTSSDGLMDDEFNRYYYLTLPNGNLAFGGPLGFTIFNPAKLEVDQYNPKVQLTDLHIINYHVPLWSLGKLREITLAHDQNFITAVFSALQFDIPEKIQYRYMLKGLDQGWIMLGNENKAAYTSLPPGNYTLLLNATNTAGKWSSLITSLQITIRPPFWKTWWFLGLLLLLVGLGLYGMLTYRIRNIKKNQAQVMQYEREAMELHALALRARMNPHFIFNCLNSIKALIQEKENIKAVDYLTTFASLIRKQLHNNSTEITLREELETCELYVKLEEMRFEDRISFVFDLENDDLLKQTKVPPLMIQPLIENAIVHGLLPSPTGGLVKVKLYRDQQYGVCEIEDNGIGRAKAEANKLKSSRLHQSRGTHLLEERISIYNRLNKQGSSLQTIDLFTPDGQAAGTLVIIKFKLDI